MENRSLAVTAQLTLKDHLDGWKATPFRKLQWILFGIALIYSYLALAEFLNMGEGAPNMFAIALYVFVALFATLAGLLVPRLRAYLMFTQSPLAKEPRQYSISDRGVGVASELSSAEYKWGAFVRIVETKALFCFFFSPVYALIIPKRFFSAPHEIPRVREILKTQFSGKLVLLS